MQDDIKNALEAIAKAIENRETVQSVKVTINLKKQETSKASKD